MSGVVLVLLAAGLTWLGSGWFVALVVAGAVLMFVEWVALTRSLDGDHRDWRTLIFLFALATVITVVAFDALWLGLALLAGLVAVAVAWPPARRRRAGLWCAAGLVYVGVPACLLVWLRFRPDDGLWVALWLLAVVVAVDTGGYVFGRLIGGPRLAPKVSPGKTWAGLAGAVLMAGLASLSFHLALPVPSPAGLLVAGAGLAIVAQAGDLLESAVKRRFGVKDSGNLIPGHGGVLDRCDGLVAVVFVVAMTLAGQEAWS